MLNSEEGVKVYIGLGSNIERPFIQIKNAVLALGALPNTNVLRDSGCYKSKPMGPEDQPDFVNAVVELRTMLPVTELLSHCQKIETEQGRIKKRHWGERTIDLDILLYDDLEMKSEKLEVPHPGICQRDFVYLPLLKLNAEIIIPGLGALKNIVGKRHKQASEKLVSNEKMSDDELSNVKLDASTEFDCHYVGNIK